MIGAPAAALALTLALTAASTGEAMKWVGRWRIVRVAGFGEISASEAQARRLIGGRVSIRPDGITLPGSPCADHPLKEDMVGVDDFLLNEWRIGRRDLKLGRYRLGASARRLNGTCADALVLDRDTLLMAAGDGALYIVARSH